MTIKETIRFREKDLDNYLEKMKKNLNAKHKLEGELKFMKKNLKQINDEINKLNNWFRMR